MRTTAGNSRAQCLVDKTLLKMIPRDVKAGSVCRLDLIVSTAEEWECKAESSESGWDVIRANGMIYATRLTV